MTWKELAELINSWPEEQQLDDVTCYMQSIDEYAGAELSISTEDDDAGSIIGDNCYYLNVPL